MFNTLYELGITAVNTFSNIAIWMFTEEFTLFDLTLTPIMVMFGGGLVLYATYTIIKYVANIFG